jgi:hypothetical protein
LNKKDYEINGTLWKIKHIIQHFLKAEQQDAKNNAELYTKCTKMTWKTGEEIFDQAETGLSRPNA